MTSRRKGGVADAPEWMVSHKAAAYCDMTDNQWKHHRGLRPPAVGDRRSGFRYRRSDLDAWMELRRLGLWADWKPLVQEHGEALAWEIMLVRLERTNAARRARAEEAA